VSPQPRQTPYHRPHSTEVLGLSSIAGGDDRYLNNLMTQPDPFGSIQKSWQSGPESYARDKSKPP
jgi:hypothetical protein